MRRFYVNRSKDVSGVSGIGRVAEGIEWDDGQVTICWLSKYHSIGIFDNIHALEQVHGHEGSTVIEWVD